MLEFWTRLEIGLVLTWFERIPSRTSFGDLAIPWSLNFEVGVSSKFFRFTSLNSKFSALKAKPEITKIGLGLQIQYLEAHYDIAVSCWLQICFKRILLTCSIPTVYWQVGLAENQNREGRTTMHSLSLSSPMEDNSSDMYPNTLSIPSPTPAVHYCSSPLQMLKA